MRILLIVALALVIVDDLVRSKMHKKYILIIMSLTFMLVFTSRAVAESYVGVGGG